MPTFDAEQHELYHYGIKRRSGRYPWGSGGKWGEGGNETARQRNQAFMDVVAELEARGLSKTEIARGFDMTTTQLRDTITISRNARRLDRQHQAEKLREKGVSVSEIGRQLGVNESVVRHLLNPSVKERAMILENTSDMLRSEVDKGGWLDIGAGAEYYVPGSGISKERLRSAVALLKDEGYVQVDVQVDQAGMPGQKTLVKTLCPPGTTYKDVVTSLDQIRTLVPHSEDGGRTSLGILPPKSVDPSRVGILYKEDGGDKSDGVVYVRPGVEDLSIGGSNYAQVRIDVGGTHYIKGMAIYKDDLPDGVDLLVSSNKPKGTPMMGDKNNTVLKNQTGDPDNPFGAVISRQVTRLNDKGEREVTSAMNLLQEEGSWDKWNRDISSQVLSKQSSKLAEQQLRKTYESKKAEYDEIASLTNPTLKRHLLDKFSDSVDSDAVHLQAAAMPRSSYHAILPFNSMKDTEIYAPNFNNGERVALIRYPHGGTFEIPELTVNNKVAEPMKAIGRAKDAVGINHKVAERLSGADFDGDFVMVIPNNDGAIKSSPALKQLENFDPQSFKLPPDAPRMSAQTKGREMGDVSNLITDMTIKGASMDEISRAVRHSMVVIDAEKHHLDYKRSAEQFGIAALKTKYQKGPRSGADTLVSKSTSELRVNKRRPRRANEGDEATGYGPIDPFTGRRMYVETGATRTTKNGTVIPIQEMSTRMAETTDAYSLMSGNGGTRMERIYADHANRLKDLANQARIDMVKTPDGIPTNPSAKKVFSKEVDELSAALHLAKMNSPRERAAQLLTNKIVQMKKDANPSMDKETLKKVKGQALAEARTRMGAKKDLITISDRQWEAIQAGAISKSMLKDILDNTDIERVKELATPRDSYAMGSSEKARARALAAHGLTQADIARILGVGLTTLKKGLSDG